jgi:hypothetical protein
MEKLRNGCNKLSELFSAGIIAENGLKCKILRVLMGF